MTGIIAIDPGTIQSAWLLLDDDEGILGFGIEANESLLKRLHKATETPFADRDFTAVIEKVESYGMAVGREVFETVWWAGRFTEALQPIEVTQMPRREVKLHLCASPKANDANIRAALMDKFGGVSAKGTKNAPGPLYGISKDVWSALALAVTFRANPHSTHRS